MTVPTPDRPGVTFALLVYNQEQYIHAAVESAFAQTYEPLEIILSDHCSSDHLNEVLRLTLGENSIFTEGGNILLPNQIAISVDVLGPEKRVPF